MHWVRDIDDVRESLTLLTDALEIIVKGSIEGDKTVNFPSSISDPYCNVLESTNNISKQNLYSSVYLGNSNFNLSFI